MQPCIQILTQARAWGPGRNTHAWFSSVVRALERLLKHNAGLNSFTFAGAALLQFKLFNASDIVKLRRLMR